MRRKADPLLPFLRTSPARHWAIIRLTLLSCCMELTTGGPFSMVRAALTFTDTTGFQSATSTMMASMIYTCVNPLVFLTDSIAIVETERSRTSRNDQG